MKRIDMSDFSGGILEAVSPGDFSDRQVAIMKGFVPTSEVELRSQGAFQKVGTRTDGAAIWAFRGLTFRYLIMIGTDGFLWWMVAPGRTDDHLSTRGRLWTQFANIVADTQFRFTGETRWLVGTEWEQALLVHSLAGTRPGVVIYESGNQALSALEVPKEWPSRSVQTTNGPLEPDKGCLPRHNISGMWQDFTVYADIYWGQQAAKDNVAFDRTNTQRYGNYAWLSEPGDPSKIDPRYPMRVAEEGAIVVGLQQVEDGLLVLTTTSTGQAGVVFLRGKPGFKADGTPLFEVVVLRPGVGLLPRLDTSMKGPQHTYWGSIGATVFIDGLGKVYHVRGGQVERIDRYGPIAPEIARPTDHVEALGDLLFCARAGRLLVMRSFGQNGSWTELVTPPGLVLSLSSLEDSMYMMIEGQPWRYCMEGPSPSERGLVDGIPVTLTLGTRTLGSDEGRESFWDGATVRLQGMRSGRLQSVTVSGGGALLNPLHAAYETALDEPVVHRSLHSVNGHGDSLECSVILKITGDVKVESVLLHWMPGEESW